MPPSTRSASGEPTPAEANRALVESAGALTDEEVEYFASICDRTDDDAALREMPDSEGWTAEQRVEQIEDWRRKRRRIARSAIRPGETADEWRERLVAQMVEDLGCAPLVIPASRPEDVLEIDLAKVRRRDRKRLYRSGGFKSFHHARRHALRVLGVGRPAARRTPASRPAALRPRRSSSSSRTSGADPGDGDDDPETEQATGLARASHGERADEPRPQGVVGKP